MPPTPESPKLVAHYKELSHAIKVLDTLSVSRQKIVIRLIQALDAQQQEQQPQEEQP